MTRFVCLVTLQDGRQIKDTVQAGNAATAKFVLHYRYGNRYRKSDILSEDPVLQAYECPVCHNTEHRPGSKICAVCGVPLPAWVREKNLSSNTVNAYRTIGKHAFSACRRRSENPKTIIIFADDKEQAMRKALAYFGYPESDWKRLSNGVGGPIEVCRLQPTTDAQIYTI